MYFMYNEKGECIGSVGVDLASSDKPDYATDKSIPKLEDYSFEVEISTHFRDLHTIKRWKHLSKYGKTYRIRHKNQRYIDLVQEVVEDMENIEKLRKLIQGE